MPELLAAPPRTVASLAVHSQRIFRWLLLFFVLLAAASLVIFWPILVKEDFEAYLQCDGPYHGRLHLLHALKKVRGRRLARQERTVPKYFVRLIYATRDGSNIFTAEHLHRIRQIETRLRGLPSYHFFCFANAEGDCEPNLSVVNYFYATVTREGAVIPDGQGSRLLPIQSILANLGKSNSFFVDRYFGVSQSQLKAALEGNVTRSVLRFGVPLRGFLDEQERGQFELFSDFVRDELRPALLEASTEDLRVIYYGDAITQAEVEATVWHDAAYAIGSLLFILVYLVFYLRSLWLTLMALLCIALSFPISYACYCLVYGHGKMIAINFLSLFVVLGVGADDVFVLHDVWALSKRHGTGEMALARRMWSMYCKAGMAIFATSATTAASFFANLASSIGPLREFGFFMGTCITVNWVIVASLYPLVLVNHERSRGPIDPQEEQLVEGTDVEEKDARPGDEPIQGWRKAVALALALLGIGASCYALVTAVQHLKPSSGIPKFFPEESNLGGLQELQMRFGGENTVNAQDLVMCHGRVQSSCDAHHVANPAPPTLPTLPPLPRWPPRPTAPPFRPRPRAAPTLRPPAPRPPPSPRPARPREEDYEVQFVVNRQPDAEELELLKGKIVESLDLKEEDLQIQARRAGRRLTEDVQVTLHFKHLSALKEHEIQDFLKHNQDLLYLLGAEEPSTATTTRHPALRSPTTVRPLPTRAPLRPPTTARQTMAPTTARPTTARATTARATARTTLAPRGTTTAAPRPTTIPQLHLKKRGMAKDRQAQVFVLWGAQEVGTYRYDLDGTFDPSAKEAQLALVDFCQQVLASKALKAVPGQFNCWPLKMKEFMSRHRRPWPTDYFLREVQFFLREEPWLRDHLGIEDGTVIWAQMDFNVEVDVWSSGRQVQPYMDLWERTVLELVEKITTRFPGSKEYLGTPVPVSDLFQRAEAENRVVNSALQSWLVSVGCALVALAIFTRSFWLSAIACWAMLSTAACSLYFITTIFHWRFGLMEAVSLIIFCGFSVDYPLHVVQAYVQERQRGAKVRHALREVGSAVASGCVTTCGAAMFLLFCQIRIFTRFGQVLVVNMVSSLIFALLWIPAVLELRQPRSRPRRDEGAEGYAMGLLGEGAGVGHTGSRPERLTLEVDDSEGFSALQG